MDVTRSQLSANTGNPVCLVRKIWQFEVFTGKEVTPLHGEGNSLQFRAGKKATHFHYNWFIDILQIDKTERKEGSQCELVNWKYLSRCDEQMKTTCLIPSRGDVRNTIGTERRRLKYIQKFYIHVKWQQNAIFHVIVEACCSEIYNWFLGVLHGEVDPFRLNLKSCQYGNSQCRDKSVIQLPYPCERLWVIPRHQTPQGQPIRKTESPLQQQNTQSSFDNRLKAPKSYGAITFFRPDIKI